MNETLDAIIDEFSERFDSPLCIAGGAVRDVLMGREPKDYDVFVSGGAPKAALDGLETVELLEHHKSEPFLVATVRFRGVLVQVMQRPDDETVDQLLDTFDWNVCLFAFDGSFHQRTELSAIDVGKPLILQRVTYPMSTLRRGFRFSERFGMRLERADVVNLSRMIVERAERRAADAPGIRA